MRPFSLTKGTSQWHCTFSNRAFHCIQAILKASKKSSLKVMIASVGREAISTHFFSPLQNVTSLFSCSRYFNRFLQPCRALAACDLWRSLRSLSLSERSFPQPAQASILVVSGSCPSSSSPTYLALIIRFIRTDLV